ncbi:hypothetical protein [Sphingomonas crocodyli]|uniref:Uncharacterized protein n=1 Tax=Sphingomonas crocodyli TaxID=1979270 RepID=A0A437M6K3_9SPHN|nr:hypothetical protein [Sphingomonas crocodyli]RVT93302.1 hypothetical protein EOD43_05295 [Sphingomonas crocodyli]
MTVAIAAAPVSGPTRTAILDSAREPVSAAIGKPVLFKVRQLKEADGWAFLIADMEEREGVPISYAGTSRADAAEQGFISRTYAALLHKKGDSWTVIDKAIGPTDVAWEGWAKTYKAPAGIFVP